LLSGKATTSELDGVPGRGNVKLFQFEGGCGILREYRRGGLASYLSRKHFLLANRPLNELVVLEHLFLHGFPSPEPLGIRWERCGILVQGAIVTRLLPGENLLLSFQRQNELSVETFSKIGAVIRWMHDLGVYHGDLHVGNILLDGNQPYIVDFDKARLCHSMTEFLRLRNLYRLQRSFRKHQFLDTFFRHLLGGYGYPEALRLSATFRSIWKKRSKGREKNRIKG